MHGPAFDSSKWEHIDWHVAAVSFPELQELASKGVAEGYVATVSVAAPDSKKTSVTFDRKQ